ncbi:TetR/AcrR family transcriptional regulator [Desulfosporosinus meridiei]|uniref:Transcriptional regulator n=1 Tax=Desulfosporosinus meridiei (strain ATCC BAA-275 / DSM 13257 / KCTC 12902 / NCIMB 13706 / S10) TaxID=768704 RepID=J7IT67_DESMD|nr:TetR/AcrR family transcriptional regulator [Desulfosporosinus meridiei]AFQ44890.1 transcriptional regulator [Desulfosporosinus meridiei DSM 13257]
MNDTREHILKVAFNLFLLKSYKEVTMAELVEKTGMSKGAFYHYFKNKEQLFLEALKNCMSSITPDFSIFDKNSLYEFYHQYAVYQNRIQDSLQLYGDDLDRGLTVNYYSLVFDALKVFPSLRKKLLEHEQDELKAWKGVISTARKNGEIRSVMNDEQIAKVFIYTNDGIAIRISLMKDRSEDVSDTLLELWDSFYMELKG